MSASDEIALDELAWQLYEMESIRIQRKNYQDDWRWGSYQYKQIRDHGAEDPGRWKFIPIDDAKRWYAIAEDVLVVFGPIQKHAGLVETDLENANRRIEELELALSAATQELDEIHRQGGG